MTIALSIAVMLVGLAVYLLTSTPKPMELGRLMFFAGLLVALLRFAGAATVHLGG